ncbi:poly(R)-hydroxyalkanoic acid synthase subunit PhaE [Desulfobacula phenolica]|uniref:Poly(3-hydroxyalkanoate) polymerase subunit PhaE n=1 Tax=Desulfobacula phenolica TaxID=90732 RepID=A0A1H2DW38_9BACT|nr:poly(R)-hydroxyalkanoic acid synthase subunit PhaE [Desulfobacula phenolica]SDT86648.1 Poly(R)-hydroxyalkanoic acid synthase subunit (PHA_synth_III_E) [Desulfobacula phenolica]
MRDEKKDPLDIESIMNTWAQPMGDIMGAMSQIWSACQTARQSGQQDEKKSGNYTMDNINIALKNWHTIVLAMATPESMASFFKGCSTVPDMLTKFNQSVLGSLAEFQKKMSQSANRFGESVDAYRFEKIDENVFHVWTELYEKEFQKFFYIPPLGLTREYQERINHMMDKFNLFQANQAEFMRLLCLPFQRSMGVMQEKIAALAKIGELPADSNEYYQMWIKILEGHFMTLFQTPEYIKALTKTISSLTNFSEAKNAVIEDMIKGLPIAHQSEIDDLSREVYELKRRIRRLEKSN